jgi:ADP-L-glycero-D-manno-heptose 6-epimerase
MIIITGGAGFIGANLIKEINKRNDKIIVVDNISKNLKNLKKLKFKDYYDKYDFLKKIDNNKINRKIDGIIHLGACSDTTENNWDYLKFNNILYTKKMYEFSLKNNCQFIYASSASIYGNKNGNTLLNNFNHKPLNLYGKSKLEIDKYFFKVSKKKVIGLRFFNVYGNYENHKKDMCSPINKFTNQLKDNGNLNLFDFREKKEPLRDFIYVNDAIKMLNFLMIKKRPGLYNIGTGKPHTFVNVAEILIKKLGYGKINYIKFPNILKNKYQYFTKANISKLVTLGYKNHIKDLEKGITNYLKFFKS